MPRVFDTRWLRLACTLLLVAVLATLAGVPSSAAAQAENEPAAIEVLSSTATPEFPNQITFALEAVSPAAEIVEAELLYGAARGSSLTIVPLEVEPDQAIAVEHVLDTRIFYMPPGVELTYRWILSDSEGNTLESAAQTITYHDTRFAWQERTNRGVTVYWYEGGAAFGDELIGTANRTLDRLQEEIGATVTEEVKIYMYANGRDMRGALRSNSVEWVGGQAFPSLGIVIGLAAPGNVAEVRRIVPHELSHQVLHQALDNPYGGWPLWFDEGLAVYNQETEDAGFSLLLEQAARGNDLIPLEALASSFPADTDRALLSYAQSHSVVAYIIDAYGTEALQAMVDDFKAATPLETVMQDVFGMSVDAFDAEWRETLPEPVTAPRQQEGGPTRAPASRFSGEPVLPGERSGTRPPHPAPALAGNPMPLTPLEQAGVVEPPLQVNSVALITLLASTGVGVIGAGAVVMVVALRLSRPNRPDNQDKDEQ